MKTGIYKKIKFTAVIFIMICICSNIALFSTIIYNYRLLNLEEHILNNNIWTMKFVSKILLYLNFIICLLASYSFNIAYKFIMTVTSWLIVVSSIVGVYFVKSLNEDNLFCVSVFFASGNLESEIEFLRNLLQYARTTDVEEAKKMYMADYGKIIQIFTISEIVTVVTFVIVLIEIMVVKRIRIEERPVVPPAIKEKATVGFNVSSLRNKILVSV